MSTWPTFYMYAWWVAVGAAVVAIAALPYVYAKGKRQIDEINWRLDMDKDERESASNVRTLQKWELARRMERKNR